MTSASVTDWPERLALVALMLGVIALVLWAMRRGWKRRGRTQADLSEPHKLGGSGGELLLQVSGLYVGSVFAGRWLDRIVAHGMGVRSRVEVDLFADRVDLRREGALSFSIPGVDLISVRADRGIAGKAYERGGLAIITWSLGEVAVDTGVRGDIAEEQTELIKAITRVIEGNTHQREVQ
ncbi:MAG: hypothetical protein NWQ96_04490 [Candidatus Nanopelagicales bacterium]|nr:hypothetical protein [Candidatus Nanopelagicales bacterium]